MENIYRIKMTLDVKSSYVASYKSRGDLTRNQCKQHTTDSLHSRFIYTKIPYFIRGSIYNIDEDSGHPVKPNRCFSNNLLD